MLFVKVTILLLICSCYKPVLQLKGSFDSFGNSTDLDDSILEGLSTGPSRSEDYLPSDTKLPQEGK